jgi:hypothetical protein
MAILRYFIAKKGDVIWRSFIAEQAMKFGDHLSLNKQ